MSLLSFRAAVRLGAPGLVGRRETLSMFFAVGAVLSGLSALPGWLPQGQPVFLAVAVAAATAAVGIAWAGRLPDRVTQGLVGCASLLIAATVAAAGGGMPSAAFASVSIFGTIYTASFLSPRAIAGHMVWCCLLMALALTVTDPGNRETGQLLMMLIGTMVTAATMIRLLITRIAALHIHDPLTGLLNDAGFRSAVGADDWDTGLGGDGASAVLVLLGLDAFTDVNALLGRDAGDHVLREVAAALGDAAPGSALLARVSGDVFGVWATYPTGASSSPEAAAHALADDLTAAVRGPYAVGGVELEIGATAGISVAPSHGKDPGELQQRAAVALAAAKRAGLAWELWTPPLQRASSSELVLQSELRHAIKDGQLRLLYQPVVAARTGEVAGVEALVRWQHPQHGLLAPSAFLAQAERSPLIVELTAWVLEEAVRQGAAWEAAGQRLPMSVNLSARLLVHDGLPDLVAGVLARHQLPAHLLTLEITETAVMANAERAMALLATLRQLGTRTSLDDFGTGFSSLSLLADLALDELKVDRRFVAGSQHGWKDAAIVATLVELGHRLGLHVVAEGVEDEATRVKLAELDYDLLQGYLFARPLTADAVQPFRAAALRAAARQSPVGTASPRHLTSAPRGIDV